MIQNVLVQMKYFQISLLRIWKVCLLGDIFVILVRTCFISPLGRAKKWDLWNNQEVDSCGNQYSKPKLLEETFTYPLNCKGNNILLQIPSEIRELSLEFLFKGDNDFITLAGLILRAILHSPIDIRRSVVCFNLILFIILGWVYNEEKYVTWFSNLENLPKILCLLVEHLRYLACKIDLLKN